ncbi:hypothetical protein F8S13_25730 [Chloroflexia bacterium SDU3-3]|nr:hypothetical protein F8S13_25730 [Chloroflexia bacterium SDU3-3]
MKHSIRLNWLGVISVLLFVITVLIPPMPSVHAAAQVALLSDIHPGLAGSDPSDLTIFGGSIFFSANDGANTTSSGVTFWKTDGTAAGTMKVKDIDPWKLMVFNDMLYFLAEASTGAYELWKSDGTADGTVLLKQVPFSDPNAQFSSPDLIQADNLLFFSVGSELWRSDGTAAGTVLVKDSDPTAQASIGSLHALGPLVLFSIGSALWRSDGTAVGTLLIKSSDGDDEFIPFNYADSTKSVQIDGVLYFAAYTDTAQTELWRSDGTAAGTFLVKDISPGMAGGSWPSNLRAIGKTLVFTTFDINDSSCATPFNSQQSGLWASDGTGAGTIRLSSGYGECSLSSQYDLATVGGVLYYTINGELKRSDGTPGGTGLVDASFQNEDQEAGGPIADALGVPLFTVYDTVTQSISLWRSDGTAAGTTLIQTLSSAPSNAPIANYTILGNTLLFTADDGVNGNELWSAALPDVLQVSASITASGGGHARALDGSVDISFPSGAAEGDFTLSIAPLAIPGQPLGELQSLRSFRLEARDAGGTLITQFNKPYTLMVSYNDIEGAGLFEPGFQLAYWNGSSWNMLLPCLACSIDPVNNRIVVQLDHFSEFAVLGRIENRTYLPLTIQ